jgi:hypothetical protein
LCVFQLQFFYQEGTSFVFTDAFDRYKNVIPKVEQCNLISAFHRRLTGNDEDEKLKVATAWSVYEMATSRLEVDPLYIKRAEEDGKFAITFARIETHYFVNGQSLKQQARTRAHTTRTSAWLLTLALCPVPLDVCLSFFSAPLQVVSSSRTVNCCAMHTSSRTFPAPLCRVATIWCARSRALGQSNCTPAHVLHCKPSRTPGKLGIGLIVGFSYVLF